MSYERTKRYRQGERGLKTQERTFIESAKMQRVLKRLSDHFGWEFINPEFRPVYINKRLKRWSGLFCGNRIELADEHRYCQKDTLWHEILHAVVTDNYDEYCKLVKYADMVWSEAAKVHKMRNKIEKAIFTIEGKGSHCTQSYKLSCSCGYWIKTVKKRTQARCGRCHVAIISPNEYRKLSKMAKMNSSIMKININNYKPWKENKRIGVKI